MSIAVFFKLDVPEVQHTRDNSKEMLVTRGTLLESGFPVPTAPGMVLIFVPRVNRGNMGWAEGGEGDNLLQRYPNHKATASRHHAVPRDRALCPPIPQPPRVVSGPSSASLPSLFAQERLLSPAVPLANVPFPNVPRYLSR